MDFQRDSFIVLIINNIYEKTPEYITCDEAYTLWLVCNGRIDECNKMYVDALLKYGYLKNDGAITPNILIFNNETSKDCNDSIGKKLSVLKDEIMCLFDQASEISRGYVVEQALKDGWLKYDDNTINTIGAYIYL